MALERYWWMLSFKNPPIVALSITAGVDGWAWPSSMSAMRIAKHLRKFTKRAPSSSSIALAMTLRMVVNLTQTGTLGGGCFSGTLLGHADFVLR